MSDLSLEILNAAISLVCLGILHRQTKHYGVRAGSLPERIGLFDALKGVCIIGVLCIHAAYLAPAPTGIYRTLDFAVPFFFVCSGYLLAVKWDGTIQIRDYYRKLFFRIVLVYVIFVIGTRVFRGQELTVGDILLDALLGRTNYNYYFIPIILQLYVLFPYIVKFREKLGGLVFFSLIVSFSFLSQICDHYIQQPYWNTNPYFLVFCGKDFAYFCFGIFLSRYEIRQIRFQGLLTSFLVFLAGTLVLIVLTGEYYLSYAYPFAAFMFALVIYNKIHEQRWLRGIEDLGRYSLVIYLVHSSIQRTVVMKFVYSKAIPWEEQILVVVSTTLLLSYIFARMFMAVYLPVTARLLQRPRQDSRKR